MSNIYQQIEKGSGWLSATFSSTHCRGSGQLRTNGEHKWKSNQMMVEQREFTLEQALYHFPFALQSCFFLQKCRKVLRAVKPKCGLLVSFKIGSSVLTGVQNLISTVQKYCNSSERLLCEPAEQQKKQVLISSLYKSNRHVNFPQCEVVWLQIYPKHTWCTLIPLWYGRLLKRSQPCEMWRLKMRAFLKPDVITLHHRKTQRPSEHCDLTELYVGIFLMAVKQCNKTRQRFYLRQLCDPQLHYSSLLWNVRWWRLKRRPPWGCLCGLPQWECQTNILKPKRTEPTHLTGWQLRFQLLIQIDKQD